MKKIIPVFAASALILGGTLLNTGCKPYKKETKLSAIDSLDHLVQLTDNSIILNLSTIKQRKDSLTDRLTLIHKYSKDSLDDQHKYALIKLSGIGSEYAKILDQEPALEYDFEKLKKDVATLHTQIKEDKLKNEEIIKLCSQYEKQSQSILETATRINKIAHSIENDYRRVGIIINPWYNHLKKSAAKDSLGTKTIK